MKNWKTTLIGSLLALAAYLHNQDLPVVAHQVIEYATPVLTALLGFFAKDAANDTAKAE